MKQIPEIDKQFETRISTDPDPVIYGYRKARELNLDTMIVHDFGLFPQFVPEIVKSLKKYGIEKVAVTDASSALMGIMWEFKLAGATVEMDRVDTGETEDRYAQRYVPGFIVTLN